MFVQVIEGRVSDAEAAHAEMDGWVRSLAPGAKGWLGSTGGVTSSGQLIAIARFESEEAARANSDRPEQGKWWARMEGLFSDEPSFHDSVAVDVELPGDPAGAGFVQVIRGRTSDSEKVREIMSAHADERAKVRPDVLGMLAATHAGGAYTVVIYFTTEAEAREGEKREMPAELQEQMAAMAALEVGQPRFYDFSEPWIYSA
jgi:hypothetical protein